MRLLPCLCAAALAASPAFAQSASSTTGTATEKVKTPETIHNEMLAEQAAHGWADAPVEERTVSSHHSVAVNGQTLGYTATAGTLTIRDNDGKPTASIFYTADTLDGAPTSRRPVMFLYNGGPGSASLWLRMGSFGPLRI